MSDALAMHGLNCVGEVRQVLNNADADDENLWFPFPENNSCDQLDFVSYNGFQ